MQQEEYIRGTKRFVRVNKTKARQKYNEGKTIYLIQDMMRLDNAWQHPCPIDNKGGKDFDAVVDEFKYYKCDSERGREAKYFIDATEV